MWERSELKSRAKAAMKGNRGACIAVAFVATLLSSGISTLNSGFSSYINVQTTMLEEYGMSEESLASILSIALIVLVISIVGAIFTILVQNTLTVGACSFFIKNQYGGHPEFGTVLDGFRSGKYGNITMTMLVMYVKIFLWSLLFVIPGIIKTYEYMMVPYILAENPGMDRKSVFKISKKMMDGQKMDAFVLELSFIGWNILSGFTLGLLGIFFVNPYMLATKAELYAFNKMRGFQEGFLR